MLKGIFIFNLLVLFSPQLIKAQEGSKETVIQEFAKISGHYASIPHLSFDVDYYYSKETTPGVHLDSLKGCLKIRGKDYWYSIDSTESVTAGGYTVILFKEDMIMYLAKPVSGNQFGNPLVLMDSVLRDNKNISLHLTESKKEKVLTIDFTPAQTYKRIEYYIDKKTGFLERIKSIVKADQLYDPSVRDMLDNHETYACVDVFYTNYRQDRFDESVFDITRYFKREGDTYFPAADYNLYKIFLGTTNL